MDDDGPLHSGFARLAALAFALPQNSAERRVADTLSQLQSGLPVRGVLGADVGVSRARRWTAGCAASGSGVCTLAVNSPQLVLPHSTIPFVRSAVVSV